MSRPDFSEFSFGFTYSHELANLWSAHLVGAPHMPNLVEEGRNGGGYDVAFESTSGYIYFAQFKLADYLQRKSAKQVEFGVPYYRHVVYGEQRSKQHLLLLDLEADGNVVEYVAPCFHDQHTLNAYYSTETVRNFVHRLRPSKVGPLPTDGQDHFVVYRPDGSGTTRYSDPMPIEDPDAGEIVESGFAPRNLTSGDDEPDDASDQATGSVATRRTLAQRLADAASKMAEASGQSALHDHLAGRSLYLRVQNLARATLGADVFVFDATAMA